VNTQTAIIAGLVSIIVATLGSVITARVARRANAGQYDVALSAEARQWANQAQAEVRELRTEIASARKEVGETRADADSAKREVQSVRDDAASMMRWIERVVRNAHLPEVADTDDPDVKRLLAIINGGPPELTSSRLRPDGTGA